MEVFNCDEVQLYIFFFPPLSFWDPSALCPLQRPCSISPSLPTPSLPWADLPPHRFTALCPEMHCGLPYVKIHCSAPLSLTSVPPALSQLSPGRERLLSVVSQCLLSSWQCADFCPGSRIETVVLSPALCSFLAEFSCCATCPPQNASVGSQSRLSGDCALPVPPTRPPPPPFSSLAPLL